MDLSVFGYLAAVTLGTGILFGLAPALHVSKTNVNDVLKEGGRTGAGGMRARRWTSALIVGELALTLVLLAGAGFMMRSFLNLYGADIGIDTTPLLTANLALPDRKYPGPEQRLAFFRQLEERLNAVGPVEAATVANSWPGGGGAARTFVIEARPAPAGTQLPVTTLITTGPRYFDTIGVARDPRSNAQRHRRPGRAAQRGDQRTVRRPALRRRGSDRPPRRLHARRRETAGDLDDDRRRRAECPPAERGRISAGSGALSLLPVRAAAGHRRPRAQPIDRGRRRAAAARRAPCDRSRSVAVSDSDHGRELRAAALAIHGLRLDVRDSSRSSP